MTVMGRANEDGLSKIASQVLEAPFHTEPVVPCKVRSDASCHLHSQPPPLHALSERYRTIADQILGLFQFAIRTSSRNHNTMKRDDVIQQIATAVGPKHSVDLKNYDRLIIVEIYQVGQAVY